jgi:hypothetical protein
MIVSRAAPVGISKNDPARPEEPDGTEIREERHPAACTG